MKTKMSFHDFLEWLHDTLRHIKDAAFGSFIYFIYGQVYDKKNLREGLWSFFMGTVFAVYLSPVAHSFLPMQKEAVSFMIGLIGMRLTEAVINQDYRKLLTEKLGLKKDSEKTKN